MPSRRKPVVETPTERKAVIGALPDHFITDASFLNYPQEIFPMCDVWRELDSNLCGYMGWLREQHDFCCEIAKQCKIRLPLVRDSAFNHLNNYTMPVVKLEPVAKKVKTDVPIKQESHIKNECALTPPRQALRRPSQIKQELMSPEQKDSRDGAPSVKREKMENTVHFLTPSTQSRHHQSEIKPEPTSIKREKFGGEKERALTPPRQALRRLSQIKQELMSPEQQDSDQNTGEKVIRLSEIKPEPASIKREKEDKVIKERLDETFTIPSQSRHPLLRSSEIKMEPVSPEAENNYSIDNLDSEDDTDDEKFPSKKVPAWAELNTLRRTASAQYLDRDNDYKDMFGTISNAKALPIFDLTKSRRNRSSSSVDWNSPDSNPTKGKSQFLGY